METQNNLSASETKLCSICKEFYGNQISEFLCSKCYQNKYGLLAKKEVKSEKTISAEENDKQNDLILSDQNKKIEQIDHKKCWTCERKTGVLGFKCRCNYTFCKCHRLPEEHNCDFDFKTKDLEKLKMANPVIKGMKLERI